MAEVSDNAAFVEAEAAKTIDGDNFRVGTRNPEIGSRTERLREAVRRAGGNKVVSARSGVPSSTLGVYLAGGEWKVTPALAIAEACGVSFEWLATGRGGVGQSDVSRPAAITGEGDAPGTALLPVQGYSIVPRYDVRAAAGAGSDVEAEPLMGYIALDDQFLRMHIGRRREDLVTIEATGESMSPTIRDGSILFVDTSVTDIDDGRVYVLNVSDRLLVKRVQLRANGHIVLRSDNPSYPPEEVEPTEADPLRIIGQVVYQAGPVRS